MNLKLTPQAKINPKGITELYVKPKTIKLVESIKKSYDLGLSKDSLAVTAKTHNPLKNINKLVS